MPRSCRYQLGRVAFLLVAGAALGLSLFAFSRVPPGMKVEPWEKGFCVFCGHSDGLTRP